MTLRKVARIGRACGPNLFQAEGLLIVIVLGERAVAEFEIFLLALGVVGDALDGLLTRLQNGMDRQLQASNQRLDLASSRFGRPSHFVTRQQTGLAVYAQKLRHAKESALSRTANHLLALNAGFGLTTEAAFQKQTSRLGNAQLRLELLSPQLVLQRGYAWLADARGQAITSATQTREGQFVRATLVDGEVDLTVAAPGLN